MIVGIPVFPLIQAGGFYLLNHILAQASIGGQASIEGQASINIFTIWPERMNKYQVSKTDSLQNLLVI